MPFGVSSGIPNVIIRAKFHVDWLRGFWAAGPPKVPFPILIGTTLTTVLHYRADCDAKNSIHVGIGKTKKESALCFSYKDGKLALEWVQKL